MSTIVIKSENDLFEQIESYLGQDDALKKSTIARTGYLREYDTPKIIFDNWPVLTIRLRGKGLEGTITTAVMPFFTEMEKILRRAYALEAYNNDKKRLTNLEKEIFLLRVKVEEGSSIFEINLGENFNNLVSALSEKITGDQIAYIVLYLAGLYFSSPVISDYLAHQTEQQRIAAQIRMEEEKTQRVRMITEAASKLIHAEAHINNAQCLHSKLLHMIAKTDSAEIGGIDLINNTLAGVGYLSSDRTCLMEHVQDTAHKSPKTVRRAQDTTRLDGPYNILSVNIKRNKEYYLQVYSRERDLTLYATVKNIEFKPNIEKILQAGKWGNKKFNLEINATAVYAEDGTTVSEYRDSIILDATYTK